MSALTRPPHVPHPFARLLRRAALYSLPLLTALSAHAASVSEVDLVSDLPGRAQFQDENLVNPWGISFAPGRPFWTSNAGAGNTTLYDGSGLPNPLIVTIPGASSGLSAPTGQVYSGASGVVMPNGSAAAFVFATEDGTLSAWNATNGGTAVLTVDNSKKGLGSVYKGLEIANAGSSGARLYATDFRNGRVDVFDNRFNAVDLGNQAFVDPNLPSGYAPFNIVNLGNQLAVSYTLQGSDKVDDLSGAGHGFVDLFNTDGVLTQRLISGGALNSPWGMAIAPSSFGALAGSLLVGNFGDGTIHAYDLSTGQLLDTLTDENGRPISIDGLWALSVRSDLAKTAGRVYFTAGLNNEANGLFGYLAPVPVPEPGTLSLMAMALLGLAVAVRSRHDL